MRCPAWTAGSAAADEGQERAGRAASAFCLHRSLLVICRADLINVSWPECAGPLRAAGIRHQDRLDAEVATEIEGERHCCVWVFGTALSRLFMQLGTNFGGFPRCEHLEPLKVM